MLPYVVDDVLNEAQGVVFDELLAKEAKFIALVNGEVIEGVAVDLIARTITLDLETPVTMPLNEVQILFYEVEADGWSLDDKRQLLLPNEKLGAVPKLELVDEEHTKNNLPDVLARWHQREESERERPRTAQSFCVSKSEIAENGYDLSLNRYKEVVHEEVDHVPPQKVLATLEELETKIQQGMKELKEMLR